MVENPVSIHKEDLEEPQVKVSRPNRPSPIRPRHPGAGRAGCHVWGDGGFLENLSPLLKVRVPPFQGVPRSPRVAGCAASPGLPSSVDTKALLPGVEVPAWGTRRGSFSRSRRTASTRKGTSRKARKPDT